MKRILSACLLASLFLLSLPSAARADIAPPRQPPGSNLEPGTETTQVRMLTETVTIDVLDADPPQAHVTALFTMLNQGGSTEDLAVRFPISANDGRFGLSEIKNVSIKVDGLVTSWRKVEGPELNYGFSDENVPWAEFDVKFKPAEEVLVKVSYDLDGTGYPEENATTFYYILSTGSGWKDTIGSAEIILRLPYQANPQNVFLWQSARVMPQFISREAHWNFSDLEPTTQDNLTFQVLKPRIWQQVLTERANVASHPDDGEAWGMLGKALKAALFADSKSYPRTDTGAAELYQESKAAYEKAVTLKPEDGLWHAGYAELLIEYHFWVGGGLGGVSGYTDDLHQGLIEWDLAIRYAPQASILQELHGFASDYSKYIQLQPDGSLVFLSLTQTPTPMLEIPLPADVTATATLAPAATVTAPAISVPPTEPPPTPPSPICGSTALTLVLPLALIAWKTRKSQPGKI